MNQTNTINRHIEKVFEEKDENFKDFARKTLDGTSEYFNKAFDGEDPKDILKFIGALQTFFEDEYFEGSDPLEDEEPIENIANIEETEDDALKTIRVPNGFNNFNSVKKLVPKEAPIKWHALKPEEKRDYKFMEQPIVPVKHLYKHFRSMDKIGPSPSGRPQSAYPVLLRLSGYVQYSDKASAGHELNDEFVKAFEHNPIQRLDRLANLQRSDEEYQQRLAKKQAGKADREKKKRRMGLSPSEELRQNNYAFIRAKMRAIVSDKCPLFTKRVFMSDFNKEGVCLKGSKSWKLANWPLESVFPLRQYSSNDIQILRTALEKAPEDNEAVALTEIEN